MSIILTYFSDLFAWAEQNDVTSLAIRFVHCV